MPQLTRITRDPRRMGGKPCIKGTRIPVEIVLRYLASELNRYFFDWYGIAQIWLAAGASVAEKTALFSDTAVRVYGLDRLPEALSVNLAAR